MANINDIRRMYFSEGASVSEISRLLKVDRKTIRKYLEIDDWNAPRNMKRPKPSKLEPYKPIIDQATAYSQKGVP